MANDVRARGSAAEHEARRTAANPWVQRLGRAGYAMKGIVYLLLGALVLQAAVGAGGQVTDTKGALAAVVAAPLGRVLLAVAAVGLLGYALWSLAQALLDVEGKGHEAGGILARLGYGAVAVSYIGLTLAAVRLASGTGGAGQTSDANAHDWTARLLAVPLGQALVVVLGLIVLGVGGYQLYQAVSARFLEPLDLTRLDADRRLAVTLLGRAGCAALGVVLGLVGLFFIIAALRHDPGQARGMGGALAVIAAQPYGPALLGVVALGLAAFGAFSLVEARYRVLVRRAT